MRSNAAAIKTLTPQEYLEFERAAEVRHEFIDGEVYEMSGARRAHNLISFNISNEIGPVIEDRDCEAYASEMRVYSPATNSYFYPDISVVCGEPEFQDDEFDTLLNPLLIIEILSESTEAFDRGDKFSHYRSIGSLHEYILVSPQQARVEKFVKKGDGFWMLSEASGLDSEIELESLNASIKLSRIYKKVKFS